MWSLNLRLRSPLVATDESSLWKVVHGTYGMHFKRQPSFAIAEISIPDEGNRREMQRRCIKYISRLFNTLVANRILLSFAFPCSVVEGMLDWDSKNRKHGKDVQESTTRGSKLLKTWLLHFWNSLRLEDTWNNMSTATTCGAQFHCTETRCTTLKNEERRGQRRTQKALASNLGSHRRIDIFWSYTGSQRCLR